MDSNNSSKTPNKTTDNSIAIIGMGALFPKSFGLKEYWRLIFHGEDAITDVPKSHWSANDYYSEDHKKPDHTYCKRGGFLSPVSFDPSEFGIPPNLLEAIDTSQILSLVIAKMALTDAGYGDNLRSFDNENTSVYLGVTGTQELVIPLSTRLGHPVWKRALENSGISPEKTEEVIKRISDSYVSWQENSFPGLLGNVVSGRICNRFNLGGTNTVVDAACASSLSAINHAILDLLAGRSNMSITGGVDTLNDIFMHMCFAKTSVLSHSGDAKPFSDSSDGTVLAEGIGMVVLKRLEDAKRDNDRIYAVIKGMGTSSDGKSGSIYAPNSAGQLKALKAAYKEADISPETVGLIEAHGTGTRVGDAVEFNAISELFSQYTDNNKCAIGTVKSMIGHAKAAAGAAGLIKTALSLYHKVLPPTLKADNPDPKLNIKESPFYLNSKSRPWMPSDNHPRRAGVSAFGFGGSNFHAVLEEYCPEKEKISWTGAVEIIAFCANKKEQLLTKLIEFKKLLKQGSSLKDQTEEFSFLAYQTRKSFLSDQNHRLIIVLDRNSIVSEIIDKAVSTFESKNNQSEHNLPNSNLTGNNLPENNLPDSNLPDSNLTGNKNAQSQFAWSVNGIYYGKGKYHGKTAFVFPGQGSQYTYMGRDLLCTFPEAGKVLSNAEVKFNLEAKEKKQTLCDHIYPLPEYMQSKKESEDNLRSTDIAQVSIGAVSIAMNKILKEFGITPEFTCGHSFGELSALCSAGWIDEDTFLSLSIARGKFMAEAGKDGDSGSMLAVRAPLEKIEEFIKQKCPNLILANRNSYDQGVLSGATDDIYLAAKLCKEEKIKAIKLPVAAAFHSSLVKSAVKPFKNTLSKFKITPGDITVFSNTTGKPYPIKENDASDILGNQLINSVYFVEEIENMYKAGARTFVEVGPKTILTGLVKSILKKKGIEKECTVLAMDASSGKNSGIKDLARSLSILAASGYPVLLDKWEEPVLKKKRKKITVSVCGANPHPKLDSEPDTNSKNDSKSKNNNQNRNIKLKKKPTETNNFNSAKESGSLYKSNNIIKLKDSTNTVENIKINNTEKIKTVHSNVQPTIQSTLQSNGDIVKSIKNFDNSNVKDALKVVQEGLKSIHLLHSQTTEAHKLFLETQAEAGRALQSMMDKTKFLTDIPTEFNSVATAPPQPVINAESVTDNYNNLSATTKSETLSNTVSNEDSSINENSYINHHNEIPVTKKDTAINKAHYKTPSETNSKIKTDETVQVILEVVSSLTGYPIEMLDLDMDIESDLGIDSIKRVEILSAVEEKLPEVNSISPDEMGTIRTLGQIAKHLTGSEQSLKSDSLHLHNSEPEPNNSVEILKQNDIQLNSAREEITENLLNVVSSLTGYPIDMLEIEMDIESDLGIDSIKRVEILSAFEECMPNTKSISPDMMGELKTLKHIIDYLDDSPKVESEFEPEFELKTEIETETFLTTGKKNSKFPVLDDISCSLHINRQIISVKKEPLKNFNEYKNLKIVIPSGHKILITDDCSGFALKLVEKFKTMEIDSVIIGNDFLKSTEKITNIAGLIILPVLNILHDKSKSFNVTKNIHDIAFDEDFLKKAFKFAKKVAVPLSKSGEKSGALFATVSFINGSFGFNTIDKNPPLSNDAKLNRPIVGGLAGLAKTASIEWPNVNCRAFDISPDFIDFPIEQLALELISKGPLETGFFPDFKTTLALEPSEYHSEYHNDTLNLSNNDVVIITGGARGVTAICAKELAQKSKASIVLIGRSPEPLLEPNWLKPLINEGEIKQAILKNHKFNGGKATPVQIEKIYKTYIANREITLTLSDIKKSGASNVSYFSADVRNKEDIKKLFKVIEQKYGHISAIIHGAGVLKDKFIADKTIEQFNKVFNTKVNGLNSLLCAVNKDQLKYLVLFSSVSARLGNKGQVDYAMANEVLNKIAHKESLLMPNCKVVSINWGPWDGGMVSSALKKQFIKNSIKLIPLEEGARCMVKEMAMKKGPVEVVIGAPIIGAPVVEAPVIETSIIETPVIEDNKTFEYGNDTNLIAKENVESIKSNKIKPVKKDLLKKPSELLKAFNININANSYPILNAHIIDGNYVVPFALMTEWFGHGALHANPGLHLYGIDDMRLCNGIKLKQEESRDIGIWVEKIIRVGLKFEIKMEIRPVSKNTNILLHAKAHAVLTEKFPDAPVFTRSIKKIAAQPYPHDIQTAYKNTLFHGSNLQGIKKIFGISEMGMVAKINSAPSPTKWIANPLRSDWILDPLIMDCAFQLAILWSYEKTGSPCLPSYMANYRQFVKKFPKNGVTAVLIVNELFSGKMVCDFTFLDDQNRVVACITGYEAVINSNLKSAFDFNTIKKTTIIKNVDKPVFSREQLLQFAIGKPSIAFGDKYQIFDKKRKIARLPGPPYFFMDKITSVDHKQWKLSPGGWIEAQYNNPVDAWFYNANYNNVMPYCILLEIALQPCGWLAAYAGSAFKSESRLKFRNLGGNAILYKNITQGSGSLKMRCRLTKVSEAGGLLIEQFDMEVLQDNQIVYKGDTTFGFFSESTLEQQVGIQGSDGCVRSLSNSILDEKLASNENSVLNKKSIASKKLVVGNNLENKMPCYFKKNAPVTPDDINTVYPSISPNSSMQNPSAWLPSGALLMIDEVDIYLPKGGTKKLGFIHGVKHVDPNEWFFKAHFYEDPVCPGSLGVESFIQLLKVVAVDHFNIGDIDNIANTHKIEMVTGSEHNWIYRGQIIPSNNKIEVEAEIIKVSKSPIPTIMATGYLKVDGLLIYKMENFGIQLVPVSLNAKEKSKHSQAPVFIS